MMIGGWGIAHLLCFGLLLPTAAIRGAARGAAGPPTPRLRHFGTLFLIQLGLLLFSLRVAQAESLALLPRAVPPTSAFLLALGLLAASYLVARPRWREAVAQRDPRVHYVMPRGAAEGWAWVALSLAVGTGAELTYRGVVFGLLARLTGDPWSAAFGSAGLFAATQATSGWPGMMRAGVSGLAFQGLAWYSGSLYLPMLMHVGFNLLAGFSYARLGEEAGYPVDGVVNASRGTTTG